MHGIYALLAAADADGRRLPGAFHDHLPAV